MAVSDDVCVVRGVCVCVCVCVSLSCGVCCDLAWGVLRGVAVN